MIILELGCGDGLLLRKLLEVERTGDTVQNNSIKSFYIGIECDSLKYNQARVGGQPILKYHYSERYFT
jgi:hypothetical protein